MSNVIIVDDADDLKLPGDTYTDSSESLVVISEHNISLSSLSSIGVLVAVPAGVIIPTNDILVP